MVPGQRIIIVHAVVHGNVGIIFQVRQVFPHVLVAREQHFREKVPEADHRDLERARKAVRQPYVVIADATQEFFRGAHDTYPGLSAHPHHCKADYPPPDI